MKIRFQGKSKLIASFILLLVAIVPVVMTSYAWLVLSGNPEVTGISVSVGGSNTIKIAADVTGTDENGNEYHYPGLFCESICFAEESGYEYLSSIVSLSPYSTADGVYWYSAGYVDEDEENGGTIKSISEFCCDDDLSKANMTALPSDGSEKGCYAYLDFWLVSPLENCSIRICSGDETAGTYAVDLAEPVKSNGKYVLEESTEAGASCALRVGFLVNSSRLTDSSMQKYFESANYSTQYAELHGVYTSESVRSDETSFTIYEPNADVHVSVPSYRYTQSGFDSTVYANGSYSRTYPIGYVNGSAVLTDVSNKLVVQSVNRWKTDENGVSTISKTFESYFKNKNTTLMSKSSVVKAFYEDFLDLDCIPFLEKGLFYRDASFLYRTSESYLSASAVSELDKATTSDEGVIVTLTKNVPQRIRMFVWLEGQDSDCVNITSGRMFAINLEFSGSTE